MARLLVLAALGLALRAAPALAIPGPATTAVVANANLPESVALARRYARARDLPSAQVCLLDLPDAETIDLAAFTERLAAPLEACLGEIAPRIEAVLLVRGVPLRVRFPDRGDGASRASLAAALGAWRSTVTATGERLLDVASPGRRVMCGGSPCTAAAWQNPFRSGRFAAGWTAEAQGVTHRPWLVTMLHGRSYADAAGLVRSATVAESSTVALASRNRAFMLMASADGARGVLDREYTGVSLELTLKGFTPLRVPFERDREGDTLAAFVTGTANLGRTIEATRFAPGSVVDNLTSFGAVPENFRETGEERQVSIARWVARGVAGVHGTTDEPLNNCFPSRRFLLDWADGLTLAEAYHRNLPFSFWRNLVLGDPMAAAWAERPEVTVEEISRGEVVEGSTWVTVRAPGAAALFLYVDGREVARTEADELRACAPVPEQAEVQLLAVAVSSGEGRPSVAKGWTAVPVRGAEGPPDCPPPPPADAGTPDLGAPPDLGAADAGDAGSPERHDAGRVDAGAAPTEPLPEGGCRCAAPPRGRLGPVAALFGLLVLRRRIRGGGRGLRSGKGARVRVLFGP